MKPDYEHVYHAREEKGFWFRARRDCITRILAPYRRDSFILDIGCSTGTLLEDLRRVGFQEDRLWGIDLSDRAIKGSRLRGFNKTFVGDAHNIDLDQKFDILIASDCLEHLAHDSQAVSNWVQLLRPGGVLLIFGPAFMMLWSRHDLHNQHVKRYTLRELVELVSMNRVTILKQSYWNFTLFFPAVLGVFLGKLWLSLGGSSKTQVGKFNPMDGLLFAILKIEDILLQHINFPWGVSAFLIAQKNSNENPLSPDKDF